MSDEEHTPSPREYTAVHPWQQSPVYYSPHLQTTAETVHPLLTAGELIPQSNDEVQRGGEQIVLPSGSTRLIVSMIYPVTLPPSETEFEIVVVMDVRNSVFVVVDSVCDGIDGDDVLLLVELDRSVECNRSSWLQIVVLAWGTVDTFVVVEVPRTQDDTSVVVVAVVVVEWMVVQKKRMKMDGREGRIEIDDGLWPLMPWG